MLVYQRVYALGTSGDLQEIARPEPAPVFTKGLPPSLLDRRQGGEKRHEDRAIRNQNVKKYLDYNYDS